MDPVSLTLLCSAPSPQEPALLHRIFYQLDLHSLVRAQSVSRAWRKEVHSAAHILLGDPRWRWVEVLSPKVSQHLCLATAFVSIRLKQPNLSLIEVTSEIPRRISFSLSPREEALLFLNTLRPSFFHTDPCQEALMENPTLFCSLVKWVSERQKPGKPREQSLDVLFSGRNMDASLAQELLLYLAQGDEQTLPKRREAVHARQEWLTLVTRKLLLKNADLSSLPTLMKDRERGYRSFPGLLSVLLTTKVLPSANSIIDDSTQETALHLFLRQGAYRSSYFFRELKWLLARQDVRRGLSLPNAMYADALAIVLDRASAYYQDYAARPVVTPDPPFPAYLASSVIQILQAEEQEKRPARRHSPLLQQVLFYSAAEAHKLPENPQSVDAHENTLMHYVVWQQMEAMYAHAGEPLDLETYGLKTCIYLDSLKRAGVQVGHKNCQGLTAHTLLLLYQSAYESSYPELFCNNPLWDQLNEWFTKKALHVRTV